MILLYLLAFLPALFASDHNKFRSTCPADEACIYMYLDGYFAGVHYFEGYISLINFEEPDDIDRVDRLELDFRLLSPNELSVRLYATKRDLTKYNGLHPGVPGTLQFALNKIQFRFSGWDEMKVTEDGVNIATPLVMDSAPGEEFRAHFTMKTKEPAYVAFEDVQLVWLNNNEPPLEKWKQARLGNKLKALTPCALPDVAEGSVRSDFTIDGRRTLECAVDDKQLWVFAQNDWKVEEKIQCINAQWTAGPAILSSDTKIKCLEPIETPCLENLTKSCADLSKCHLEVTPKRVSCPGALRIIRNWNSTFEKWEDALEIFCHDGHWAWMPQNGTLGPKRIGRSKISCASVPQSTVEPIYSSTAQSTTLPSTEPPRTLAQGALVWWLIGGTVSLFFVLFLVIIALCYFRNRVKKRREPGHCPTVKGISGSSKGVSASSKETEKALGVVRSSRETAETPLARSPAEKWRIKWRSDSRKAKPVALPSKETTASSRNSADKVSAEQISFTGAKGSADRVSAEKVSAEQLSVTGQGQSKENFSRESQKE